MSLLPELFPQLGPALVGFWVFFKDGGFLIFIILAVFLLYQYYMITIIGHWKSNLKWVYLNVKMPRENLTSLLAVEQIYSQLHAAHRSMTMAEKYIEGRVQLWYSFEIISFGGKINYIVRVPEKFRDTAEAAFYAVYPEAEITQVNDYLENFEFHPGHSDYEIFGTELKMRTSDVLPIKTYRDLEHPSAEVKIVDPTAPLIEALTKIDPDEFLGVQIIAQPLADNEWQDKAKNKAKELLGEHVEHHESILARVFNFFAIFAPHNVFKAFFGIGGGHDDHGGHKESGAPKNNLLQMTEVEKDQVNAIQTKASKPGYLCKIRYMYLSPKEKFDRSKRVALIGAFRTLSDANKNGLKPDSKLVSTRVKYRISKTLEGPYIQHLSDFRKHHFFEGWKSRSYYIGMPQFILNSEELATLFHLPLTDIPQAADVAKIESKKSQAPANLPTGTF
jgi:hypothetical protein